MFTRLKLEELEELPKFPIAQNAYELSMLKLISYTISKLLNFSIHCISFKFRSYVFK